jgi:hypothetical protein
METRGCRYSNCISCFNTTTKFYLIRKNPQQAHIMSLCGAQNVASIHKEVCHADESDPVSSGVVAC